MIALGESPQFCSATLGNFAERHQQDVNVLSAAAKLRPSQVEALRKAAAGRQPVVRLAPPPPDYEPPRRRSSSQQFNKVCLCCQLPFAYEMDIEAGRNTPEYCATCELHWVAEDASAERCQLKKCKDHEQKLRRAYEFAAKAATNYEQQVQQAYEKRRKWKRRCQR